MENENTARRPKRPVDFNQLAAQVVAEATGEAEPEYPKEKNPAAVALGRLGGLKGGKARASKLTSGQKKEIAEKAAQTRWEDKAMSENMPTSPFAKYKGEIQLGDKTVECYVLDNGERVISLRATVKAIANRETGDLAQFIGVSALKSFINKDLILAELLEFSIPGTQFKGLGIKSSHFEEILHGYMPKRRRVWQKAD